MCCVFGGEFVCFRTNKTYALTLRGVYVFMRGICGCDMRTSVCVRVVWRNVCGCACAYLRICLLQTSRIFAIILMKLGNVNLRCDFEGMKRIIQLMTGWHADDLGFLQNLIFALVI